MVEPYTNIRNEVQQTHKDQPDANHHQPPQHSIVKIHADDYDIQASIVTEQTQYLQLSAAATAVYNGIRNILIGATFLLSGIINVAYDHRFTQMPPVAVDFYYLACCTAMAAVFVLISPALWATYGNPVTGQMTLLLRARIIVPTGIGLLVVSFLSMLGVQSYLIFHSVAISVGTTVCFIGLFLIFWLVIPYTVKADTYPGKGFRNYLYKGR